MLDQQMARWNLACINGDIPGRIRQIHPDCLSILGARDGWMLRSQMLLNQTANRPMRGWELLPIQDSVFSGTADETTPPTTHVAHISWLPAMPELGPKEKNVRLAEYNGRYLRVFPSLGEGDDEKARHLYRTLREAEDRCQIVVDDLPAEVRNAIAAHKPSWVWMRGIKVAREHGTPPSDPSRLRVVAAIWRQAPPLTLEDIGG
ncbi:MAG: hypothetical protein ACJAZO_001895 [Myxococcota bacterium]|jgi:hypothetical protein